MSPIVAEDELVEPSRLITSSLCRTLAEEAKVASRQLALAGGSDKNAWLVQSAEALWQRRDEILAANDRDVAAAPGQGLGAAAIERLTLNLKRIGEMAQALRDVAALADPIGETVTASRRPNGLEVSQVARASGGHLRHLREPSERDGRRGRALRQERQRGDLAGGQGSDPHQPHAPPHHGR